MKEPKDYTLEEINKIWYSNKPASLTEAYHKLWIKCEHLEDKLKNHSGISNVSDAEKLGKIDDVLENTPVIDLENYDREEVKIMNETLDAIADIIG